MLIISIILFFNRLDININVSIDFKYRVFFEHFISAAMIPLTILILIVGIEILFNIKNSRNTRYAKYKWTIIHTLIVFYIFAEIIIWELIVGSSHIYFYQIFADLLGLAFFYFFTKPLRQNINNNISNKITTL
jgi:hypothetical protein